MRAVSISERWLKRDAFEALQRTLLESPLVGATTLNGPFQSSRGFAVTFKAEGEARVLERFPALAAYLPTVLGAPAVKALTPLFRSVGPAPNAWYLNVLLVGEGAAVDKHIDGTLAGPAQVNGAVPSVVSVLYLRVPKATGGELVLFHGAEAIGQVEPRENRRVHFRGDLAHQVRPFSGAAQGLRASLVIEQYVFEPEALARIPDFQLDSRAGFSAHLALHARLPAKQLDLDTDQASPPTSG